MQIQAKKSVTRLMNFTILVLVSISLVFFHYIIMNAKSQLPRLKARLIILVKQNSCGSCPLNSLNLKKPIKCVG